MGFEGESPRGGGGGLLVWRRGIGGFEGEGRELFLKKNGGVGEGKGKRNKEGLRGWTTRKQVRRGEDILCLCFTGYNVIYHYLLYCPSFILHSVKTISSLPHHCPINIKFGDW